MTIAIEPLSWELMDLWKASGLPVHAVEPTPIVVVRNKAGKATGFVALAATMEDRVVVVAPLIATVPRTWLTLIEGMERALISAGLMRWSFYVNEYSPKVWVAQVQRAAARGILTRLGETESGAVWYERDMQPLDQAVA